MLPLTTLHYKATLHRKAQDLPVSLGRFATSLAIPQGPVQRDRGRIT